MEGACENPAGYTLPGEGTLKGGTRLGTIGTGGGRAAVQAKWRGTEAELRELASMPELAAFEWRDEFASLLAAWDSGWTDSVEQPSSQCAIS